MNQCPHNLDLYQWIVGMPVRAHGFVSFGKHHQIEVETRVTAYFEARERHGRAFHHHDWRIARHQPAGNRGRTWQAVYEDEKIVFYRNEWSSIKQIRESEQGFEAVPNRREPVAYELRTTHGHERIIENFADAILHGAALIAPAEEG